jgi:FAD/FMN-containing dehydrogenase
VGFVAIVRGPEIGATKCTLERHPPLFTGMTFELLQPHTPAYETARRPQIARYADVRPDAIARCRTPTEVAEAIAYGRQDGADIAIRSGGHCFAGRSSTTGVLIDVSPMNGVRLDHGLVTVGAGAKLAQIYDALEPNGVTIAGGCGPTVGIAGLALGGGIGILGRRHGLTCDQVVAADVVLADGSVTAADDDLLWGLRGSGGGQFGVVTSLTLRTVPAPPTICFHARRPHEDAAELIAAWQAWAPDAPASVAASLLVNPSGVHLFGAAAPGDALLDGVTADVVELPYREAKRWLAENGPGEGDGSPFASRSEYFDANLPEDAIRALVEHFPRGGPLRELDFNPLGGAYNDPAPDATAFPNRSARFLLKHTAGVDDREWLRQSYEITHPHGTGGAYVNFPDPDLEDPHAAYHGPNLERLRRVKAAYDPEGVFRFPQSI